MSAHPAPVPAHRSTVRTAAGRRLLLAVLIALVTLASHATIARADALDDQVRDIARTLRCPICESVSVAESQSELSLQMRQVIREQLEQGRTRDQIVAYFVERYGETVLFDPPKRGFSLLVWAVTPLGLLGGAAFIWRLVRHRPGAARARAAGEAEPAGAAPADALDPYRARVRAELARLAGEAP
ncbi:MAG TPA: cytochrome c-type biogenesis protein [Chloroflexota bacterium]|nr:cytochrome c-type biogenesis protein [Chloroflexota bacterium]